MEKIRASELRINNIVEADGIIQRVYRIWQNGAELVEQEDGDDDLDYHENDIYPVKLTEEYLLKFGFEITKQTKEDNNIWTFIGSECKFELEQIIDFHLYDNMCFGTQINYVHQLQNLYFALTNEELLLSLPQ